MKAPKRQIFGQYEYTTAQKWAFALVLGGYFLLFAVSFGYIVLEKHLR